MSVKEFIQLDDIDDIHHEIRELNYKILNTMNQTNIIQELVAEKNALLNQAQNISNMLIPEVRALNAFVNGEQMERNIKPLAAPIKPKVITGRRPGRPRKIKAAMPKIPKQLNDVLPANMQQKSKRGRGRPRKVSIKETPVVEQANRENPLEELRRNLARLRQ
jgi:hypothetical protein